MKIKKLLVLSLLALGLGSSAYADMDMYGQITAVDNTAKTITLSGNGGASIVVQVFPYTELKGDDCGIFGAYDTHEKFTALKPGMFIQVDGMPSANGVFGAREIEWQCGRRAY